MAKGSTETKKDNPKEDYEGFIKAYASWVAAQSRAEELNSTNASARDNARNYAIEHADANMPGYSGLAQKPVAKADVLRNPAAVDSILDHAIAFHGAMAAGRYSSDGKNILNETPEKGLAAIALKTIPAGEIEDKAYEEAAKNHASYQALKAKLPIGEDGTIDHRKMNHAAVLDAVGPHIAERTKKVISGNKYLAGDKNLLAKSLDAAIFIAASSSAACLHVAESMLVNYASEFNKCLPTDSDKAGYARELVKELAPEMAMGVIYRAHQVAEELKKKGKKK